MRDSQDFLAGRTVINVAFAENGRQPPATHLIQESAAIGADRGFVVSLFTGDHFGLLFSIT
jgi:hypothetical protein